MSVVDAELRVYGIANLRVADASIMPRVTTGNTMAPCVVIGERAASLLIAARSPDMRSTIDAPAFFGKELADMRDEGCGRRLPAE